MMIANQDIRNMAKINGVRHWQIAEYLHINEGTFSRYMRKPLDAELTEKVHQAIKAIAAER